MDISPATGINVASHIAAVATPCYLDFDGALAKLRELGFNLTKSQLRERIRRNELPFFKDGHKLYISENTLVTHYRQKQLGAEKKVKKNERN